MSADAQVAQLPGPLPTPDKYAHFACVTCGRVHTLPHYKDETAVPWCLHESYTWEPHPLNPNYEKYQERWTELGWTPCVRVSLVATPLD